MAGLSPALSDRTVEKAPDFSIPFFVQLRARFCRGEQEWRNCGAPQLAAIL